jgi:hypothetical protein
MRKLLLTSAVTITALSTTGAHACGFLSACRAPGVHAYFGPQLRLWSRPYYGIERVGPIG